MLADTTFGGVFTFTRSNTAYDFDASGVLTSYAANAIRSNTSQGWLLEAAATNSIRNPRGEWAVTPTFPTYTPPTNWATGSGTSWQYIGRGTENGLPYVDVQIVGAGSAGAQGLTFDSQIATTPGVIWTNSYWVKLLAGTPTGITFENSLLWSDASTVGISQNNVTFVPNATMTRIVSTGTAPALTAFALGRLRLTTPATPFDCTIRLYSPQQEVNYYASSLILPVVGTPAATARSADLFAITGSAFTNLFGGLTARANLNTFSEQFDNAAWTKAPGCVINADAVVGPFGASTADRFVEGATIGVGNYVASASVTWAASQAYTQSIYAKASDVGSQRYLVGFLDIARFGSYKTVMFDLVAGTLSNMSAGMTATITAVGNGWYRCTASATTTSGGTSAVFWRVTSSTADAFANNAGDLTSGMLLFGAQLETGSTATAYIPTTTAIAYADGATRGCIVVDVLLNQVAGASSAQNIIQLWNNPTFDSLNRIILNNAAGSTSVIGSNINGAQTSTASAGTVTPGTLFRCGIRWTSGSPISVCKDGGTVVSSAGNCPVGLNEVTIGRTGAAWLNGRISKVRAYGYAPTDAEFQSFCSNPGT